MTAKKLMVTCIPSTNFIPLSEGTISEDTFKDKDIVLGQYFRVVSEAQTANGARAALVWHTNGRSSLRFGQRLRGMRETEERYRKCRKCRAPLKNKDDAEEIFDDNRLRTLLRRLKIKKDCSYKAMKEPAPDHFLNTRKNTHDQYRLRGLPASRTEKIAD